MKKDTEDLTPKQKLMNFKDKKKNLSRMQRKVSTHLLSKMESSLLVCVSFWILTVLWLSQWKKAEEKLQKELLETEASESKDKKLKLVRKHKYIVGLYSFNI